VRVFGIGATAADVVAVLRRGPAGGKRQTPRPGRRPIGGTKGGTRPWLVVSGGYAAHRSLPQHYDPTRYDLLDRPAGSVLEHLGEVQWAD
jgi:hypothetical protein